MIARCLAGAVALALALGAPASADQAEQQIGAQVYQQLQARGEILTTSPYYATLNPIAARISAVANPQYDAPFHFILVHESQPNAFSVPGGNVYVTDSMMGFVHTKEELAGVLCHETSHTIHHDVMNLYRKNENLSIGATLLSMLIGGGQNGFANFLIENLAGIESLHFSRDVEAAADHKGAITCAQAGIDPWGMVWLMRDFEAHPTANPPEFLSDHPSDSHRISNLENEFASDPAMFGKFNPNVASGTPIRAAAPARTAQRQAHFCCAPPKTE